MAEKSSKRKVGYEVRTSMLNARNKEARLRRGRTTGPRVWCSNKMVDNMAHTESTKCARCSNKPTYFHAGTLAKGTPRRILSLDIN